ncbi:hypothetical protein [Burkholderia guangdongensis]|uniref:hypothetical protein n=1 Tax=Burkholderia guangdongensis TaxID=1792500 RepID=UPI0015C6A504|nr:hypothetical protein [Burkholderia guangdongensis]
MGTNLNPNPNPIDDAGALKALLVNLYTGWGYNAYRQENKDRADDQIIRNGVCALLGEARAQLTAHVAGIRRAIPTPSRENPFPGADERARIAVLDALGRDIEAVEALIRHLPVPENDATWRRHRSEREFLPRLADADEAMAGLALQVREDARSNPEPSAVSGALAALRDAIDARKRLLSLSGS